LPDGIFAYPNSQLWYIFEALECKKLYTLFGVHFPILVNSGKKNLATLHRVHSLTQTNQIWNIIGIISFSFAAKNKRNEEASTPN
jgi:hypothetical protein